MTTTSIHLLSLLSPVRRLAGPMFNKELRVASRQRRYYVLRFAYVCLLAVVVIRLWYTGVRLGGAGSAVVWASRLGEAGKRIVTTIVWFQFIAVQILAVVLLSDAISGEIRQRTLDALLVTPMGSFQIVVEKLLSKLLQLVLLLAVSLPLLAIVRVFGGVPWDYLVSGVCMTLTAAIFAGALSLLASIACRDAYHAILAVVVWYLIVWGLGAGLLIALGQADFIGSATVTSVLFLTNPFAAMVLRTQAMFTARMATGAFLAWPVHCSIMLAAAAIVLLLCVWRVRRITLTSILARTDKRWRRVQSKTKRAGGFRRRRAPRRAGISRVKGSPVIWKELRRPSFLQSWRSLLYLGLLILAVVAGFAFFSLRSAVGFVFVFLARIFQLLFVVRLAVSAAGTITKEKEARTWPVLLATPLENAEIIRGKALAAFRANLPLLVPLLLLYSLTLLFGVVRTPQAILFVFPLGSIVTSLTGTILFLIGLGLYFGVRLKTTTTAIAATLGVYFGSKLFGCGAFSPLFFMFARVRGPGAGGGLAQVLLSLIATLVPAVVYAVAGLLFARAASRRLRRGVFS